LCFAVFCKYFEAQYKSLLHFLGGGGVKAFLWTACCCQKVLLLILIKYTIPDPQPELLRGRSLETRVRAEDLDVRVVVEVGGGVEGPPRTHHDLLGHAGSHGINPTIYCEKFL